MAAVIATTILAVICVIAAIGWWIEASARRAIFARWCATDAALGRETHRRIDVCNEWMRETGRRIAADRELAALRAKMPNRAADGRFVTRRAGGTGSLAQTGE